MPFEGGIHAFIDLGDLPGVPTQQVRPQFLKPCPDTVRIRRQIERPQWTDFAIADMAGIGLDSHECAVKHRNRLATRPVIAPFTQRKLNTMGKDPGDDHEEDSVVVHSWSREFVLLNTTFH